MLLIVATVAMGPSLTSFERGDVVIPWVAVVAILACNVVVARLFCSYIDAYDAKIEAELQKRYAHTIMTAATRSKEDMARIDPHVALFFLSIAGLTVIALAFDRVFIGLSLFWGWIIFNGFFQWCWWGGHDASQFQRAAMAETDRVQGLVDNYVAAARTPPPPPSHTHGSASWSSYDELHAAGLIDREK